MVHAGVLSNRHEIVSSDSIAHSGGRRLHMGPIQMSEVGEQVSTINEGCLGAW